MWDTKDDDDGGHIHISIFHGDLVWVMIRLGVVGVGGEGDDVLSKEMKNWVGRLLGRCLYL